MPAAPAPPYQLFRKQPVVVRAIQYTGANIGEIEDFVGHELKARAAGANEPPTLVIPTLEGNHQASPGDWVIQGVKGEFYPCKWDIFEMTYDRVQSAEELLRGSSRGFSPKTLGNTDVSGARKNVPDLVVFGDGDVFELVSKASSQSEGWMKSTKAMNVPGGCVVQVTTQQRNPDGSYALAEAVCFVPGVEVFDKDAHGDGEGGCVTKRGFRQPYE